MTAVRNHVQHYGLAVHSVSYNGHWTGGPDDDSRKLRHQFTAAFGPWHLAADHKVDRALLAELEGRANQKGFVPLLPLIREYVEGLSELNHHSRELFAAREAQWKVELAALREAWAAERDSARHPGLTAVQRDEAGNCVREVPLEIELEERLEHLRRMNGRLHNLSRREIVA
jgi:hypothetical protein